MQFINITMSFVYLSICKTINMIMILERLPV